MQRRYDASPSVEIQGETIVLTPETVVNAGATFDFVVALINAFEDCDNELDLIEFLLDRLDWSIEDDRKFAQSMITKLTTFLKLEDANKETADGQGT